MSTVKVSTATVEANTLGAYVVVVGETGRVFHYNYMNSLDAADRLARRVEAKGEINTGLPHWTEVAPVFGSLAYHDMYAACQDPEWAAQQYGEDGYGSRREWREGDDLGSEDYR